MIEFEKLERLSFRTFALSIYLDPNVNVPESYIVSFHASVFRDEQCYSRPPAIRENLLRSREQMFYAFF